MTPDQAALVVQQSAYISQLIAGGFTVAVFALGFLCGFQR